MRKSLFLFAAVLAMSLTATAQTQYTTQSRFYHLENDTVFWYWPTYVYEWDAAGYLEKSDSAAWTYLMEPWYQKRTTDSSIHIIGIAAILLQRTNLLSESINENHPATDTIPLDTLQFLKLYDATPNGIVLLDSIEYSNDYTTHPIRWITFPERYNVSTTHTSTGLACDTFEDKVRYYRLREYYFNNNGFYVSDSFFIGTTSLQKLNWTTGVPRMAGTLVYRMDISLTNRNGEGNLIPWNCSNIPYYDIICPAPYQSDVYPNLYTRVNEHYGMSLIFPIIEIDTTTVSYDPERYSCHVPENLRLVHQTATNTFIRCDESGNTHWELAYGPHGVPFENCTVMESNSSVFNIPNLDTNQAYDVYVRGWCTTMAHWSGWSDWSAPLSFGGSLSVDAERLADAIKIAPNPAKGQVFVKSREQVSTVEIFGIDGNTVAMHKVSAKRFTLPLHDLADGTYILRFSTPKGAASKLLTVE